MEKTAYGAKLMLKQKTILYSNSISVLGIPSTDSQHNGKCNICAFHEEIHAFEDWIFVRLSSLVLASEWTTTEWVKWMHTCLHQRDYSMVFLTRRFKLFSIKLERNFKKYMNYSTLCFKFTLKLTKISTK